MQLPPIRQLQYLVALQENLHFGRAAAAMNVTLSIGIRELENSLGITLVPNMALGRLESTNISTTQLPIQIFYRDIGFAWRKGHSWGTSLHAFMQLLPNPEVRSMDA